MVIVGNGPVDALGSFVDNHGPELSIYTDPERHSYAALSLKRSFGGWRGLSMVGSAARALGKGHVQGRTQGAPLQMGGVFVVDAGGAVLLEQRSETAGDHAATGDVLRALDDAGSGT